MQTRERSLQEKQPQVDSLALHLAVHTYHLLQAGHPRNYSDQMTEQSQSLQSESFAHDYNHRRIHAAPRESYS
jgi:hypothetical protein